MTADDDNTLGSKKPGHRIKGFFKAMGSSSSAPAKSKVAAKSTSPRAPEAAPKKAELPKVVEEPATPVVEKAQVEAVDKSVAAAYVDDNDGSAGGACAACEGCTIL